MSRRGRTPVAAGVLAALTLVTGCTGTERGRTEAAETADITVKVALAHLGVDDYTAEIHHRACDQDNTVAVEVTAQVTVDRNSPHAVVDRVGALLDARGFDLLDSEIHHPTATTRWRHRDRNAGVEVHAEAGPAGVTVTVTARALCDL